MSQRSRDQSSQCQAGCRQRSDGPLDVARREHGGLPPQAPPPRSFSRHKMSFSVLPVRARAPLRRAAPQPPHRRSARSSRARWECRVGDRCSHSPGRALTRIVCRVGEMAGLGLLLLATQRVHHVRRVPRRHHARRRKPYSAPSVAAERHCFLRRRLIPCRLRDCHRHPMTYGSLGLWNLYGG